VGVLSLALIVFLPSFVAAIWVLVVSVGMFARGGFQEEPPPVAA
jgi:hypothetical protein